MPARVFISRPLTAASVFLQKMTAAGWAVTGQSLIEFAPVPFGPVPAADWLFFYSKNGVRFFLQNAPAPPGPAVKLAAIGPATATFLAEQLRPADFVGDGSADTTATAFLAVAAGQRVLFPRAANSRRSIQLALADRIEGIDLVVYQNSPKKNLALPNFEVLVFTSPLNAKAYFAEHALRPSQRIVAIGQTTARALSGLGVSNTEIATAPAEAELASTVLAGA